MNFPYFDVPLIGGGLLIGIVAIVHIFVSHFAIGGGLYLVLTERFAYREKSTAILDYVKTHTRFFILLTLVFGAVTGVGIWFTIGLVHPAATSTLIHSFVWGWAIEWVFFIVEIAAAFCFYYSWQRVSRKTHLAIGWIYFVAAWLSLVIINGILTFMLTSGGWIESNYNFWVGFFNPTYFPSVVIRTAVAIMLAGLYGLLTASMIKTDPETKATLVRYNSKWLFTGLSVMTIGGLWYILVIPERARYISMGGAAAVTLFAVASVAVSAFLLLMTWLSPWRKPKEFTVAMAIVFMVLGFVATGVTEWTREAVRKPYVIDRYMFSNGLLVSDTESGIYDDGILQHAKWVPDLTNATEEEVGYQVFRINCIHCHQVDGYNGLKPLVYGWDEDLAYDLLDNLADFKMYMPPFQGSDEEKRALAKWMAKIGEVSGEVSQ